MTVSAWLFLNQSKATCQRTAGFTGLESWFLKLEGALWRREWAQTELANMLLGGLAKEKGTVSTQDEYGRKQHGTCQTIQ